MISPYQELEQDWDDWKASEDYEVFISKMDLIEKEESSKKLGHEIYSLFICYPYGNVFKGDHVFYLAKVALGKVESSNLGAMQKHLACHWAYERLMRDFSFIIGREKKIIYRISMYYLGKCDEE